MQKERCIIKSLIYTLISLLILPLVFATQGMGFGIVLFFFILFPSILFWFISTLLNLVWVITLLKKNKEKSLLRRISLFFLILTIILWIWVIFISLSTKPEQGLRPLALYVSFFIVYSLIITMLNILYKSRRFEKYKNKIIYILLALLIIALIFIIVVMLVEFI